MVVAIMSATMVQVMRNKMQIIAYMKLHVSRRRLSLRPAAAKVSY